jgi:CO/xanthine dehydrogenase Mo-binding subunit
MEHTVLDNPYPLGPYGAKGVGELTLVGGAPAVAMAIEMAIKRNVSKIPLTPESIRKLVNA